MGGNGEDGGEDSGTGERESVVDEHVESTEDVDTDEAETNEHVDEPKSAGETWNLGRFFMTVRWPSLLPLFGLWAGGRKPADAADASETTTSISFAMTTRAPISAAIARSVLSVARRSEGKRPTSAPESATPSS